MWQLAFTLVLNVNISSMVWIKSKRVCQWHVVTRDNFVFFLDDSRSVTPRHDDSERRKLIQQQNEAKRLTQVKI
jgi:hypothetical protein